MHLAQGLGLQQVQDGLRMLVVMTGCPMGFSIPAETLTNESAASCGGFVNPTVTSCASPGHDFLSSKVLQMVEWQVI